MEQVLTIRLRGSLDLNHIQKKPEIISIQHKPSGSEDHSVGEVGLEEDHGVDAVVIEEDMDQDNTAVLMKGEDLEVHPESEVPKENAQKVSRQMDHPMVVEVADIITVEENIPTRTESILGVIESHRHMEDADQEGAVDGVEEDLMDMVLEDGEATQEVHHHHHLVAQAPGNGTDQQRSGTIVSENDDVNSFVPPVDVFSTERAYVLHIALPGAKKEDVGVHWDEDKGVLNIAGVVYRQGDEEFLQTLAQSERKVGVFERIVKLPPGDAEKEEVDGAMITAKLEDGVLVVTVPKVEKEWTEVKKVDIM
ncbi:putative Heat shock protein 16 [Glarea lozoyensis 74030]|uniref:Putative Heat shock protein 16 n=1 Tax=Glarea lozoyensis (strain ATCC 74030 / MF5533) TaxID=1104152 RepID=H0ECZ8_GLAL7|nr:putative Heat shock protein 16 [Glarea lozoyensis 74030]